MTKKLYYDNPVEALYMAETFGVKFNTFADSSDLREQLIYQIDNPRIHFDSFYIAPESMGIFEARDADICIDNNKPYRIHNYFGKGLVIYPHKIIQRNGKAFINPKCEGENE